LKKKGCRGPGQMRTIEDQKKGGIILNAAGKDRKGRITLDKYGTGSR